MPCLLAKSCAHSTDGHPPAGPLPVVRDEQQGHVGDRRARLDEALHARGGSVTNSVRCFSSALSEARTVVGPVRARAAGATRRKPVGNPCANRSWSRSCRPTWRPASGARGVDHPMWTGWLANGAKMAGTNPGGEQEEIRGGRATTSTWSILGAGSGGYACALRAAQLGLTVALVEKGKVGGTCLHVGCIPTKALLHAAEVADSARESEQFGVNATLEGIDMAGVNTYKDGVVSRLFKGLTGLIKGRGITVVEGDGRLARPAPSRSTATAYTGTPRRAGLRLLHQVPARSRDRRRAGHHLRARAAARPGARVGDRARRRRHRRRVRQRVAVVRRRGHHHRGAAPARAGRGRGVVQGARAGLPQAQDRRSDRHAVRERRARTDTASRSPSRAATTSRPTSCWSRSAAARPPTASGTRSRASRWTAASCSPTSGCAPTSRASTPSATSSRPAAGPPRLPAGHLRGRGDRRARPRPDRRGRHPRVTYCDPEVASVGLTEAQAREEQYGDDEVETLTYDLGGNGKSQILKTQGFVKLVRRKDGPSSASTWSAPASASSSARPS